MENSKDDSTSQQLNPNVISHDDLKRMSELFSVLIKIDRRIKDQDEKQN